MNRILAQYGTTIFTTMSAWAQEFEAVNLGQGFPDDNGPDDVRAVAAQAVLDGPNQYPPMAGTLDLRAAVAAHDKRFYGLDIDPIRGVLVAAGATEILASALLGLLNSGDEVIVFEPLYDSYVPMIRLAGAVPVVLRLSPPDWQVPQADLAQAITARTRMILINTPQNPCGKVWTFDELSCVASLAQKHDLIVVCDEVYEHLVYPPARHVPLMTLPGLADRTLKIGSAGKTFSLTGWKVGYVSGPPPLIEAVAKAHQFLTFTTPPNLQTAVAYGLRKEDAYFHGLSQGLQSKRDHLARGLTDLGFSVLPIAGGYFLSCGYERFSSEPAMRFSAELVQKARVATIPYDPFYVTPNPPNLIRFCFAKQPSVLDAGLKRLQMFVE